MENAPVAKREVLEPLPILSCWVVNNSSDRPRAAQAGRIPGSVRNWGCSGAPGGSWGSQNPVGCSGEEKGEPCWESRWTKTRGFISQIPAWDEPQEAPRSSLDPQPPELPSNGEGRAELAPNPHFLAALWWKPGPGCAEVPEVSPEWEFRSLVSHLLTETPRTLRFLLVGAARTQSEACGVTIPIQTLPAAGRERGEGSGGPGKAGMGSGGRDCQTSSVPGTLCRCLTGAIRSPLVLLCFVGFFLSFPPSFSFPDTFPYSFPLSPASQG